MKLLSPAFENNGSIPKIYTCQGQERSIPLKFEAVPKEAKSLVLIMEDPDVPKDRKKDGMWDHWVVFNISPSTKEIPENAKSFGTHGRNTSGSNQYQGPCPPDREHRYFLRLYALDTLLDLEEGVSKLEVQTAMQGHVIAQAELMGRYVKT